MTKHITASGNNQLDILLELVCVKLQLSQTQFKTAESRYGTISEWLLAENSDIQQYQPEIYPQGSLSLGTTVKPWSSNEFDLDLVCQLNIPSSKHPGEVYQSIWNRMAENETYRKMMKRLGRCIRLEYANDFHLDIVPAVPDPDADGEHILVPDLYADLAPEHPKNNIWKPSNPRGYKDWFKSKCYFPLKEVRAHAEPLPQAEPVHQKPSLKRAVQLFKRWRDIRFKDHSGLEPPSIILTTLAGYFHDQETLCSDALETIIDRTVEMRSDNQIICMKNPANDNEIICERWQDRPKSLELFDVAIQEFQDDWKKLLKTRGLKEITAELKRLFGESPVEKAVKEFAERQLNIPRQNGQLLMEKTTRRIVPASASTSQAVIPVKDTTFYGED